MDAALRILIYCAVGLALLVANLWFVRSVHAALFPSEYVIAPFRVIGDEKLNPDYGATLAEMLTSRIASLLKTLEFAQRVPADRATRVGGVRASETNVTTLFVPQGVEIPTGLLQTVNINVSVGSVQVGGVLTWLQNQLPSRKPLSFALVRKGDGVIVSADLGDFVTNGEPYLWLQSGKDPDEVVTDIAYALIQKKIAEKRTVQVSQLEPKEFRVFMETLVRVEQLNEKVRARYVVDGEFAALLPRLEALEQKAPQWHELTYLAASVAESAGNRKAAIMRFDKLAALKRLSPEVLNPVVVAWVEQRDKDYGVRDATGLSASEQRFIADSSAFAKLMSLSGADPKVVFKRQEAGIMTVWDEETRRSIVNPDHIDSPGLPQYVALMGRFMERNFERCFGKGKKTFGESGAFWNEFRYSVVAYLIQSVPGFSDPTLMTITKDYSLYKDLKALEVHGVQPVQRLALELLERFDCDWSQDNLADRVRVINEQRGLLPVDALRSAFTKPMGTQTTRRRTPRRSKDADAHSG